MKKYLFIILLVGVCFGQDVYPYFRNMEKQLEFERRKIVIEEGESTQQIISGGGSEFNLWSLVIDSEPRYKTAPIETRYRYISYFNIQIDGKVISEIEMLKTIGLNQEALKIISDFNKKLKHYEDGKLQYEKSMAKFNDSLNLYNENFRGSNNWETGTYDFYIFGGLSTVLGIYLKNNLLTGIGVITSISILFASKKDKNPITEPKYIPVSKPIKPAPFQLFEPVFKQQLSTSQTKSMVEAYNRKLYSEIAKK